MRSPSPFVVHGSVLLERAVEIQPNQPEQLLVFQFGQMQVCAAFEQVPGKLLLPLDHLVDLFLDRSPAHELVYQHVLALSNTKSAVRGLVFHSRIPPSIEMHDVKGCCKRSEEHTSELQSLTNLVCRLLLEKKKKSH